MHVTIAARPDPAGAGDRMARHDRTGASPVVSLRDARFGYAGRMVVTGVTLDLPVGQILAVLGANGSGKSTLVKGLLGLSDQQHGDVRVFGVPIARLRDRYRIGYVPQRHVFGAGDRATVAEIVAVGRLPHLAWHGRMKAVDRAAVTVALDVVGLSGRAMTPASTLSGGQQRRVLIARALASAPELLIMDEPTAGVDDTNRRILADVMGRLAADGRTLVVVTHELTAIERVVDRAVVLASGRVVFDGSPDGLAAAGFHDESGHHHSAIAQEGQPPILAPAAGPLAAAEEGEPQGAQWGFG